MLNEPCEERIVIMSRFLVTGGLGFIGFHMSKYLEKLGYEVCVVDSNVTSNLPLFHAKTRSLKKIGFRMDLRDQTKYGDLLTVLEGNGPFDCIFHFAGLSDVGESVRRPTGYLANNVGGSLALIEAMENGGCDKMIFSSSCTVYGGVYKEPISEFYPRIPQNPYGKSKLMIEDILVESKLKTKILRYFNVAGNEYPDLAQYWPTQQKRLIPLVCQAAFGRRDRIEIFGNNHKTPDGTCVRDFVHVQDLCEAHWLAYRKLVVDERTSSYNIGSGKGCSVLDIVTLVRKLSQKSIDISFADARECDASYAVADSTLAKEELGWFPKKTIEDIVKEEIRTEETFHV